MGGTSTLRDPLEQYHSVVREHDELVGPRLEQIRKEVDQKLDELRRLERRHLTRQRRALASLRQQLRTDARFVLRSVKFALFAEQLRQAGEALPEPVRAPLPRDPAQWGLGAMPLPVAVVACEAEQEEGYEDEHDCLRDLLTLRVRVGSLTVPAQLERGQRSLTEGFREVALVYQHRELAFLLEDHLQELSLGEGATRHLASEIAAVVLYAAPILLEDPAGASFSYP